MYNFQLKKGDPKKKESLLHTQKKKKIASRKFPLKNPRSKSPSTFF